MQFQKIILLVILSLVISTPAFAETPLTRAQIESRIKEVFSDAPIMVDVARCESTFRQFADSGNVFRGGTNRKYIGIFQIGEDLHRSYALARGFDIDTVEGNIGYARYMYDRQGTRPWVSCLSSGTQFSSGSTTSGTSTSNSNTNTSSSNSHSSSSSSFPITRNLEFGMVHAQAYELQKILNEYGFQIAESGPGSPGNETARYGALTRKAVERFQCAKNIVCPNGGYIAGYGYVGPRTRAALEKLVEED